MIGGPLAQHIFIMVHFLIKFCFVIYYSLGGEYDRYGFSRDEEEDGEDEGDTLVTKAKQLKKLSEEIQVC